MTKRLLSLCLCIVICLSFPLHISAEEDIPHRIYRSHSYVPAGGLLYTVNTLDHMTAGREEEHILRYRPDPFLRPLVYGADKLYGGTSTMITGLERLRSQGLDPVAAINGDFFNGTYGTPISLLIQNGVLKSFNNDCAALGFAADGTALIGSPTVSVTVTGSEQRSVSIDSLNKVRQPDQVHLYTKDFGETTHTSQNGLHIVLDVSEELRLGQSVSGTVKRVLSGKTAYTIGPNEMVLSASTAFAIEKLSFLTEGMYIVIYAHSSLPEWNQVVTALGGLKYLVAGGVPQTFTDTARTPRTAAGLTAEGDLILYTVDGRQPGYSIGLTNSDQAKRMLELGCVTAIELDGGGSTAMGLRMPGDTDFRIVNKPSDSALRKCANFLFFCNTAPQTEAVSLLFPEPAYVTMLANSTQSFGFRASDAFYHAVPAPLGGYYGYVGGEATGIVDGASFTALTPGRATLTFYNTDAKGTAEVFVTDKLDTLTLLDRNTNTAVSDLHIAASRTFAFTARGALNLLPVVSSPDSFLWETEGDIGVFLEPGIFLSGEKVGATGFIIVSGGGLRVKVPVTVGSLPLNISDFESSLGILGEGSIPFHAERITEPCLSGFGSAKLSYQFLNGSDASLSLPLHQSLSSWPSQLHMLIRGDGSGNTLSLRATAFDGTVSDLKLCVLDFNDTRVVSIPLPDRCTALNTLLLTQTGTAQNGVFFIDELLLSWEEVFSETAPYTEIGEGVISFGLFNIPLRISDTAGTFPSQIRLTWDGEDMEQPIWDENGEGVFLIPPPEEGLHILSLETVDMFGRKSKSQRMYLYSLDDKQTITDVSEHWSKPYVYYLFERGVIDIDTVFGFGEFSPDRPATRIEIFQMLARLVVYDESAVSEVVLPFSDLDGIHSEDIEALRILYSLGLLVGKPDGNGGVFADPYEAISRADLCVLLARAQPKGVSGSRFEEFTDAATIPAYAKSSMRLMVDLNVLEGYNQMLHPTLDITRAECATLFCRLFY